MTDTPAKLKPIDLEDLDLDEMELLEDMLDKSIDEIVESFAGGKKVRIMKAMVVLAERRNGNTMTLADVGKFKASELDAMFEQPPKADDEGEEDPNSPAAPSD